MPAGALDIKQKVCRIASPEIVTTISGLQLGLYLARFAAYDLGDEGPAVPAPLLYVIQIFFLIVLCLNRQHLLGIAGERYLLS
jgi:hypothetical protein